MKDALESRLGERIVSDCWAVPWLIKHAAAMMNRLHVQANGKTAYADIKGRSYKREVLEFGERLHCLQTEKRVFSTPVGEAPLSPAGVVWLRPSPVDSPVTRHTHRVASA